MTIQDQHISQLPPAGGPAEALGARRVSKSYGAVRALVEAEFSAAYGEVHALVGENGAGKSTLIRTLCGIVKPDSGMISIAGQPVALASPRSARELGISTVFQELTLMRWMSVAENLFLTDPPKGRAGLIKRSEFYTRAESVLARYGLARIDPKAQASELSVADQQLLEIVRALERKPDILILDEPTAALGAAEVEWLFDQVSEVKARGGCVLFTSHRWSEVAKFADRITVFRDGTNVGVRTSLTEDEAVQLMTGRHVDRVFPVVKDVAPDAPPLLEVSGLKAAGVNDVTFTVRRGEVLGVGGLGGQGQRALFSALFGVTSAWAGRVSVSGKPVHIRKPSDAIEAGLILVPEDRKSEGLLLTRSVRDNLSLSILPEVTQAGILRRTLEEKLVRSIVGRLSIKSPTPSLDFVGGMSGGNQQKVLLGRSLLADPQILLFYDVTRGVDVATKHEIYELIAELAGRGRAVLMFSSETEEIAHLSHRVLVLHEGRIRAELSGDQVTAESIVAATIAQDGKDVDTQ